MKTITVCAAVYAIVLLVRHLGNRECIGSVVLLFVVWRVRSIFYQLVGLGWVDFFHFSVCCVRLGLTLDELFRLGQNP